MPAAPGSGRVLSRSHLVSGPGKRALGRAGGPGLHPALPELAPLAPRAPHRCGPQGLASSHLPALQRTVESRRLPGGEKPSSTSQPRQRQSAGRGCSLVVPMGPGTRSQSRGFQPGVRGHGPMLPCSRDPEKSMETRPSQTEGVHPCWARWGAVMGWGRKCSGAIGVGLAIRPTRHLWPSLLTLGPAGS